MNVASADNYFEFSDFSENEMYHVELGGKSNGVEYNYRECQKHDAENENQNGKNLANDCHDYRNPAYR